jgi:hypothetical protein
MRATDVGLRKVDKEAALGSEGKNRPTGRGGNSKEEKGPWGRLARRRVLTGWAGGTERKRRREEGRE